MFAWLLVRLFPPPFLFSLEFLSVVFSRFSSFLCQASFHFFSCALLTISSASILSSSFHHCHPNLIFSYGILFFNNTFVLVSFYIIFSPIFHFVSFYFQSNLAIHVHLFNNLLNFNCNTIINSTISIFFTTICVCLSVCLSTRLLSFCLLVCNFMSSSICLSVYIFLFIYLCTYLCTYLYIMYLRLSYFYLLIYPSITLFPTCSFTLTHPHLPSSFQLLQPATRTHLGVWFS